MSRMLIEFVTLAEKRWRTAPALRRIWTEIFFVFIIRNVGVAAAAAEFTAAMQLRPGFATKLNTAVYLLTTLPVWAAVLSRVRATAPFSRQIALVGQKQANARSGPSEHAQASFAARDGMELSVLDRHAEWV